MLSKLRALRNHDGFMKYFKNTSWLFGEKILRMIVGLFVGVWIARYLGPEKFGLFSYAQSFVGLFAAFATLGLDGIVIRELVKDASRRDELIGTAFWLKLTGAFAVIGVLAVAVHFTSNDHTTNILVFIIASATIFQSFNVIDMYFQSQVMGKYIVYANVLSLLLSSFVKIALILYHAPLIAFAYAVMFDNFVLTLGYLFFFNKTGTSLKSWRYNKVQAVVFLKDSWPLFAAGISFTIFSNIDSIMLHELLNNTAVGLYTASYKLVTLWYFFPGLILNSFMPSVVAVHNDREQFFSKIRYLSTFLLWFAILLAIVYILFADYIIELTYGKNFLNAKTTFMILAWVNILIFFNSVWNQWMMIENNTRRTLLFHFSTALFNILLNYLLIPQYGSAGAAYALLLSLIMTYTIYFLRYNSMFHMFVSSLLFGKWRLKHV